MLKKWLTANWILSAGLTSIIILLVFRATLVTAQTHLLDTFDFPYYAWVLNHGITFLRNPTTAPFANTNAYFLAQDTYFFSDLLLPQAVLGLLPSLLGWNPITITNTIVISTLILNAFAISWFWQSRFSKLPILIFATITTALSPFLFTQLGHLQMLTLWPFFLALGILSRKKTKLKTTAVYIGLIWTIQLLASFYLAVFLLAALGWYCLNWFISNKKEWRSILIFCCIFGLVAGLLTTPFLTRYYQVKQANKIKTQLSELITFSAHPTDYLFIAYPTVISKLSSSWQKLNHHNLGEVASYPGTATLVLAIGSLIGLSIRKDSIQLRFSVTPERCFFAGLLLIGLIFSLGPRLSVNGSYVHLPLPYWVVLKIFPFLETVRATARWSFFFHLGLTYFAALTLNRIKNPKLSLTLTGLAIFWFLLEMVRWDKQPLPMAHALDSSHPITQACQNKKTLAIYPFTEQHPNASLTTNLARKTAELLRSTQHDCLLANGYGGFEPPTYTQLEQELNQALNNQEIDAFWQILIDNKIELFYVDSALLGDENKKFVTDFFADYELSDMINPPITVISQQKGSWYLVELNRYDTVKLTSYGK